MIQTLSQAEFLVDEEAAKKWLSIQELSRQRLLESFSRQLASRNR